MTIEFGENETGNIAANTYGDTHDDEDNFLGSHEARDYLVPDGVDWPDNTSETAGIILGADDYGGHPSSYLLADFEDHFGLTILGPHDRLAAGDESPTCTSMADFCPT